MSDDYIKKALLESTKQLAELFLQDQELMKQHLEVQKQKFNLLIKVHGLAVLCGDVPTNSPVGRIMRKFEGEGLTGAIERVMSGTGEWLTPAQIRDYLIRLRIDLTRYKNPGGSIHTILGRLIDKGRVERKLNEKTKKQMFRWQQPSFHEDINPEEIAAGLIAPDDKKRRGKKSKAETPLLTEGSLKKN